jgi:L-threonylcarbamoyladenylate synthase
MKRIKFAENDDVLASIPKIIDHLRANQVIAYPTETVYGLGSLVEQEGLERVAELKERDETKPFLLLVSNPAQCAELEWNEPARKLAQAFWPGPLTLALKATSGEFPQRVLSQQGTVAVRETPHPALRRLLDALGEPITSTSANLPRSAPAASADEAAAILETMGAANVLLLDGGVLPPMKPSTLVDCSVDPIRVLRVGSISVDALRAVVEQIDG